MSVAAATVQKVLVITLSNLGDAILTLPVFQRVKESFPAARVDVLASAVALAVFENDPRIGKLIPYDKKASLTSKWRLLVEVRKERYDLILDLRHSLFGTLGGARVPCRPLGRPKRREHRVKSHLRILKGITDRAVSETSFLAGAPVPADRYSNLFSEADARWVIAFPGSKSDTKKWPAASYAALLDRLEARAGCRVILAGDANDRPDVDRVRAAMRRPAVDLCGQTSFRDLYALVRHAALVVTNDSAPLHLADALKVPTVALFGPTDPLKYGPRLSSSVAVSKRFFCSPCEKAQCRYRRECLNDLGVDEVYAHTLRVLEDRAGPPSVRILVIRLDRIGDVVLSYPALSALRARFPTAWISVMVRRYTKEAVEGHPLVDETIVYDYGSGGRHRFPWGYLRFWREILQRRFDAAVVFHPSVRSHLLPFLAGIPYRIGLGASGAFLLTHAVPDRRCEGLRHESEYALEVARVLGAEAPGGDRVTFPFFFEQELFIEEKLSEAGWQGEPLLAVHAGASCPSKRWPVERFVSLVRRIVREWPHRVILVGGAEETEAAGRIQAATSVSRVLNWAGRISLKQLAALFQRCETLVSNDSGPVHVAAAVGIPTVTVFGRNQSGLSPHRWRALGENHFFLQKDVGCAVCLAHRCPIQFECLRAVDEEEVWSALCAAVEKRRGASAAEALAR